MTDVKRCTSLSLYTFTVMNSWLLPFIILCKICLQVVIYFHTKNNLVKNIFMLLFALRKFSVIDFYRMDEHLECS